MADGVRVLELGSSAAIGIACMVLADNGAQVVKVEPPGGDPLRSEPAFRMWARGKQSLVADLGSADGRARVRELAGSADVVLAGLKPDSLERFGLNYASLAPANERLVHGSLSGFGSLGPYRNVPAYDGLVAAKAGRAFEFSALFDGERPAYPAAPVATHGAAMLLLQGVFGALRERELSGRGQSFETSLVQALGVYDLVHWAPGSAMQLRLEDAPFVPYTVARTSDGVWIQFAQNGPALFEAFVNVLGLAQDANYRELLSSPQGKPAELRAMRAAFLERIGQRTWREWEQTFEGQRNISAEPFLLPGEALNHPQLVAIGDSREYADPEVGATQQLAPLVDFSATPARPSGPAPQLNSLGTAGWLQPANPLPTPVREPRRGGILEGVTVLEFATWIATPFSCTQLADLGARVIKVEPLGGDPMRMSGPIGYKTVQGKDRYRRAPQPCASRAAHSDHTRPGRSGRTSRPPTAVER